MKKLESSLTNMVIVLVAVAVLTGGILAWVNKMTEKPIREQSELTLANGIKNVMGVADLTVTANDQIQKNIGGKDYNFIIHQVSDKNGNHIGVAVESTVGGFGGDLKVLVGFGTNNEVLGYTILQTSETPGLGVKADKWFQKDGKGNIIGRKMSVAQPLTVSKDGGDIDAITASTITSRAFLKAINQAYAAYTSQQDVDVKSGATSRGKSHR